MSHERHGPAQHPAPSDPLYAGEWSNQSEAADAAEPELAPPDERPQHSPRHREEGASTVTPVEDEVPEKPKPVAKRAAKKATKKK